jgi:hypothetical protein
MWFLFVEVAQTHNYLEGVPRITACGSNGLRCDESLGSVSDLRAWKSESVSLREALLLSCSLSKERGVFVKTVFSASEKFDSAPVKLMRGPCHLFVKRCLQLVTNVPGRIPGFSQCLCFSPQSTPGQHVREAKQWFIHKLHRGAGPLMFFIRQVVGNWRCGLPVGDCVSLP